MERFHVPVEANQFRGQPVEKFRMRRPFAAAAEVFRRPDQASAEMMLPEPIRRDARGQCVLFTDEPTRERIVVSRFRAAERTGS